MRTLSFLKRIAYFAVLIVSTSNAQESIDVKLNPFTKLFKAPNECNHCPERYSYTLSVKAITSDVKSLSSKKGKKAEKARTKLTKSLKQFIQNSRADFYGYFGSIMFSSAMRDESLMHMLKIKGHVVKVRQSLKSPEVQRSDGLRKAQADLETLYSRINEHLKN